MALSNETYQALNEVYGQTGAWFTVQKTPDGFASEEIREQWVGLMLPVRAGSLGAFVTERYVHSDHTTGVEGEHETPVPVTGVEAVHALEIAGRTAAAEFWTPYMLGSFVFKLGEGTLELIPRNASHQLLRQVLSDIDNRTGLFLPEKELGCRGTRTFHEPF